MLANPYNFFQERCMFLSIRRLATIIFFGPLSARVNV